jgi:MFS transporter, ACS family, aldohexuronate transporter
MSSSSEKTSLWVWWVCGLLLLASTINYMDRQTLSGTSDLIKKEFNLSNEKFALVETAFSIAFAVGASLFGFIADRTSVRWLYPVVLLLWSAMGFMTGFVETYMGLLICRLFLGLFEAGHWPCALKTTQRLLPPSKRTLGNSVLQSGTAIGAMVTPLVIKSFDGYWPGSWRPAFQILGVVGVVWVALWLISIRSQDLGGTATESAAETAVGRAVGETATSFVRIACSRKYLTLVIVVICINVCWHQFRFWMQLFLIEGRGYSRLTSLDVIFWFNVMTDIGCLSAGFASALLTRRGLTAHRARCWVFGVCALLVASGAAIPLLKDAGPGLIAVLMIVGLGALGLFPCYYAFTQELSVSHQGKVTGSLGTIAWVAHSVWVWRFGRLVDETKSYDLGMCLVSLMPLVAIAALLFLWPREPSSANAPAS